MTYMDVVFSYVYERCYMIYIYIYRERERERYTYIYIYAYIHIYIYIYTCLACLVNRIQPKHNTDTRSFLFNTIIAFIELSPADL
jgi:hypothetical protein